LHAEKCDGKETWLRLCFGSGSFNGTAHRLKCMSSQSAALVKDWLPTY
jgi:hypothetical protein